MASMAATGRLPCTCSPISVFSGFLRIEGSLWSDILVQVVQKRLTEEYERCQNYLDASTRKPLISAVEEQLLSKHMAAM